MDTNSEKRMGKSGEHTRPACWFQRPRRNGFLYLF